MSDPHLDDDNEIDETTSKEEGHTRWMVALILGLSALGLGWAQIKVRQNRSKMTK